MSINIAGMQPIDDPEYRYKMPRLVGKIEGRGNGIKTVVVNCVDIATSLHRSAPEITKFFGCELGAQSKYDANTERSVVNGAFDTSTMQQHLSKFIESFVLCPNCRLPETKYKVKGQIIFHKCYACGAMEPVDMNHKLTTFILKEHAAAKRSKKGDKDDKKKKKKEKKKAGEEDSPGSEKSEKKKKDKKEKKEKKDKKDKKDKKKSKGATGEDEIEWHTDLSAEAVALRAAEAQELEAAAQSAMIVDDDPESAAQAEADADEELVATLDNCHVDDSEALENCVANLRSFLASSPSTAAVVDEVRRLQTNGGFPATDRVRIFCPAAMDENILKQKQINKYSECLSELVSSNDDQRVLIGFCEELCARTQPKPYKLYPVLLKMFYDEDILEEDVVLSLKDTPVSDKVTPEQQAELRSALQPFVEWLENAEEESDDDEDDEE